jgi:uncharacterized hydrophobic protein (TIGR00271 family)
MLHLRIVAPEDRAEQAFEVLSRSESVCNVIRLPGAAKKPSGDVLLADVAREDASVLLADLEELEISRNGSIALENVDTEISEAARRAEAKASGVASDAVVWEEVEERTSENTTVSVAFLAFMVIAMLIAAVGILNDQPILIVGAMVVGPEFGPVAGFCVAVVQRKPGLAWRSIAALGTGFPFAVLVTIGAVLALRGLDLVPPAFSPGEHPLTAFISQPDVFSVLVALLAGSAGVLSLTSAKSGALIGVLISVTTIPSAANVGVAAAYRNWDEMGGAAAQLGINLASLLLAGVLTLFVQRLVYQLRWRRHQRSRAREQAGLSTGEDGAEARGAPGHPAVRQ